MDNEENKRLESEIEAMELVSNEYERNMREIQSRKKKVIVDERQYDEFEIKGCFVQIGIQSRLELLKQTNGDGVKKYNERMRIFFERYIKKYFPDISEEKKSEIFAELKNEVFEDTQRANEYCKKRRIRNEFLNDHNMIIENNESSFRASR